MKFQSSTFQVRHLMVFPTPKTGCYKIPLVRHESTDSNSPPPKASGKEKDDSKSRIDEFTKSSQESTKPDRQQSIAEQDEQLRQKMAGLSGEGGEAGVEYEDGQPVAMKRGVRNNMFRYI